MPNSLRLVLWMLAAYLAAVLQTSLAPMIEIRGAGPDFLALLAIGFVLVGRSSFDFVGAAVLGFVADLSSAGPLGLGMACYSVVGYGLVRARTMVRMEHLATQLAAVALGTAMLTAMQMGGLQLAGYPLGWAAMLPQMGITAGYTAGIALPILMVVGWIREFSPVGGRSKLQLSA